ncbi:MAG TPA: hypothetical protein ENG40_03705, partial [Thermoprotei archaeon]|nr:hypothetical protein [Thermoprotei archaeon]
MNAKNFALYTLMTFLVLIPFIAAPLGNVDFFVAGDGTKNEYNKGETVYLKGKSLLATVTLDVKVDLIYPSESGRGSITILPRRTKTFSGINTIAEYYIQENDPEGTYVFRVTAWDTSGNLIGQIDVPFQVVVKEEMPIEAIIVIIVAAIIIILSIALVVRRRQQQEIEPQTQVVKAYFQLGNHVIPISSLPQNFGREDFVGMVPENILKNISRRMKPQFTIHYDYSRG